MASPREHERGLRVIIAYKFVRGVATLTLGVVLLIASTLREGELMHDIAEALHHHVTGAWSIRLADLLLRLTTPHYLHLGAIALALDGALALFEGWALHKRFVWSPWVVAGATATLLPFEVIALVKHRRIGRALILVVNVAIVVYLVREALAHARRRHS